MQQILKNVNLVERQTARTKCVTIVLSNGLSLSLSPPPSANGIDSGDQPVCHSEPFSSNRHAKQELEKQRQKKAGMMTKDKNDAQLAKKTKQALFRPHLQ